MPPLLVAVTVNGYEPDVIFFVVFTVIFEVPEPLIVVGPNRALANFGSPLTARVTVPE